MSNTRAEYLTRDSVLKLLSDAEVKSVCTAETSDRLANGDEYLDLQQLGRGVQRAYGVGANMSRVVPRKAVHAATWSRMLTIVDAESHRGALPPLANQ